jgi:hypothetical protein
MILLTKKFKDALAYFGQPGCTSLTIDWRQSLRTYTIKHFTAAITFSRDKLVRFVLVTISI